MDYTPILIQVILGVILVFLFEVRLRPWVRGLAPKTLCAFGFHKWSQWRHDSAYPRTLPWLIRWCERRNMPNHHCSAQQYIRPRE